MLHSLLALILAATVAVPSVSTHAPHNTPGAFAHAMSRVHDEDVIAGQWAVGVSSPDRVGDVRRSIQEAGGVVRQVSRHGETIRFEASEETSAQVVDTVASDPSVTFIEPVLRVQADFLPADPLYASQWGLEKVGAVSGWNVTKGSSSTVIAIVDTGVSLTHPDLAANIDTVNDYDFVNADSVAADDEGHGTHVAGIAAAITNQSYGLGVAPACTILPVKVLDSRGGGTSFDVSEGIRWAADHGAAVINLSLGSSSPSDDEQQAVSYAQSLGRLVVAAAGNDGTYAISYPAGYSNVIGVGATDSNDIRASFSTYGPAVDIAAPGVGILSTALSGGTVTWDGTSMATPFVSGAAALIKTIRPAYTQTQIANVLLSTALDKGTPGRDDYYGYGRLDVATALGSLSPDNLDDDIPGALAPASPVGGSLGIADPYDVYRVPVVSGSSVSATLAADAGTEFDLYLYGVGAGSMSRDSFIASSVTAGSDESVSGAASATGYLYMAVARASGSGAYALTYEVSPPRPDLKISSFVAPSSAKSGGTASVNCTVSNVSSVASTGFNIRFYLSTDPVITTSDVPVGVRAVASLAAGAQSSGSSVVSLPSVKGAYYLGAIADADRAVSEADETNNSSAGSAVDVWVNTPPIASDDTFACIEDGVLNANVLSGDSDPDGDPITVQLVSAPSHGTLQLSSNGSMTYRPAADFFGVDSFTYRDYDGREYSPTANVTINVSPVNDPPVLLGPGIVTVAEDSGPYTHIWATALSAGPTNESGQAISVVTTCSSPALFSALPVLALDGTLAFTPAANAHGSSVVTVTVTDDATAGGPARSTSATFTVSIYPVADATSIALTSSSRTLPAYGAAYTLSGILKSAVAVVGGRRVVLQASSSASGPFSNTAYSAITDAQGGFVMPAVVPASRTYYRARFAGVASDALASSSTYVCALPRPYLGRPVAVRTAYKARPYTVYGFLKPRHIRGSYPVLVYKYRYESGRWRSYGYVKARAYDYSTYTKYVCSVTYPLVGRWRLRAYAPTDALHAYAWSLPLDYVTVR